MSQKKLILHDLSLLQATTSVFCTQKIFAIARFKQWFLKRGVAFTSNRSLKDKALHACSANAGGDFSCNTFLPTHLETRSIWKCRATQYTNTLILPTSRRAKLLPPYQCGCHFVGCHAYCLGRLSNLYFESLCVATWDMLCPCTPEQGKGDRK